MANKIQQPKWFKINFNEQSQEKEFIYKEDFTENSKKKNKESHLYF